MGPHGGADAVRDGENEADDRQAFENSRSEAERCAPWVSRDSERLRSGKTGTAVLPLALLDEDCNLLRSHLLRSEVLRGFS